MIHLDISSSQTAFIARSAQRLPRHAMQVRSGMAMRAVRELGTLWKRGLQVSQCHSASNFSESRLSSCNKECQCHKVPPGMAISSFAGPGGLRSQCRKCHCSVVLSKTTATVFKASVLKSLAILQIKLGTTWNRLKVSAHPRFPATKSVRLPAFYLKSSQLETLCNFARHGVGWTHAGQTFCTSNSKH